MKNTQLKQRWILKDDGKLEAKWEETQQILEELEREALKEYGYQDQEKYSIDYV